MEELKEQSERDELGNYLANEFNVELCEIVAKRGCFRLISQLQFFRWLYSEYDFIKANKSTPILVQNRLKELERTRYMKARDDFQHLFPGYAYGGGDPIKIVCILTSLAMLIRNECEVDGELQDKELRSCLLLVEQKLDAMLTSILRRDEYHTRIQIMREVRSIVRKRKFDFSKVENHIKTLPDTKAKLQYLIEIQSDYSQQDLVDDKVSQNFGGKCRVEINKLERLMALEESDQGKNEAQVEADGPERDGSELSIRQRALIMHYIFGQLDKNKTQFKPARLAMVAALTGKKAESIKNIAGEPLMFKGSNLTERQLEKDLGTIKPLFKALGLNEILRQIDRDMRLGRE